MVNTKRRAELVGGVAVQCSAGSARQDWNTMRLKHDGNSGSSLLSSQTLFGDEPTRGPSWKYPLQRKTDFKKDLHQSGLSSLGKF